MGGGDPIETAIRRAETERAEATKRADWVREHQIAGAKRCREAMIRAISQFTSHFKDVHPPYESVRDRSRINFAMLGPKIILIFDGSVSCVESDYPSEHPELRADVTCKVCRSDRHYDLSFTVCDSLAFHVLGSFGSDGQYIVRMPDLKDTIVTYAEDAIRGPKVNNDQLSPLQL